MRNEKRNQGRQREICALQTLQDAIQISQHYFLVWVDIRGREQQLYLTSYFSSLSFLRKPSTNHLFSAAVALHKRTLGC